MSGHDVSITDHRNRFRVGKCGKYERVPETVARSNEKLKLFWADPANRERQSKLTRARMAQPGVSEKISAAVSAALADPAVKARQRAGLARAWDDPAKREQQAALTRERMAKWRAERLREAETVLQQMPRGEREAALAGLASAARGGAR